MTRQDAVDILVQHQAASLVRNGVPIERAQEEAYLVVDLIVSDLSRMGLHDVKIGVALRRALIYRLRSQGVKVSALVLRLGVCKAKVCSDYKSEQRRRGRVA